jgi:hypothetical protein
MSPPGTTMPEVPTPSAAQAVASAAAVVSTVCGGLYLLGVVVSFAQSGAGPAPHGAMRLISAVIALAWNVSLVVLFAALRSGSAPDKAVFTDVAAAFFALMCVSSSTNWFIQLTAGPRILLRGDPALSSLVDPFDPGSITYAMEHLGWGLFLGIGSLFAARGIDAPARGRLTRWLLTAAGVLSLVHFAGIIAAVPVMRLFGYASWGLFLPAATWSCISRGPARRP